MEQKSFEEKTVVRKEIFKGKVIDVVIDQVQLPDGRLADRELVFHPGAVAILPFTKDHRMILVKQYRKALEKNTLEIPAGKIDGQEQLNPQKAAKRELEEETGYQAKRWSFLVAMYVAPGFSNELVHIFCAQDLEKVNNPLPQDEDENIQLYTLTLEEAKKEIVNGFICDAKTIFAVQYWEMHR